MHGEYLRANPKVPEIEKRLRENARQGCLDKADIREVVLWGSKKIGARLWSRIDRNNTDGEIERYTAEAIKALPDSAAALEHVRRIYGLGESFGSKVVAFMHPEGTPVLDRVVNDCLGNADNWTGLYRDFIALCEHIAAAQPEGSGPREGIWFLRDIEMALFQFAWPEKGKPTTYITGKLPLGR